MWCFFLLFESHSSISLISLGTSKARGGLWSEPEM